MTLRTFAGLTLAAIGIVVGGWAALVYVITSNAGG